VRGGQDLKAVAGSVLTFLRGPSVSSGGQALLFLWIKGFLPSATASSASSASSGAPPLPLDKLLGPRS
jgi:phospholipid/cholesterol/gamma-HCH transport system substrate-binding protein